MCGIAGYFSRKTEHQLREPLEQAIKTLSKRGPDLQQSITLTKQIGFAHARLSIIDTSVVANQPMQDGSGRFTIIFNGEIFNFAELRERYLPDTPLISHSDTEVLLYLYIKLGKDCLQHLNGFFAFAIYDAFKNEIFLARDRYGIKPLHVFTNNEQIIFASELKAILCFPVQRQIDYNSLLLYLQLNYIPGNRSMLRNISKVPPGHFVVIDGNGDQTGAAYYQIPYRPGFQIAETGKDYDQSKATLKSLIEDAVERRMISDVPLGTFLSGGIDSSIITACASKHTKSLRTFSVGYKNEPYFDETFYANLVAEKFKTNHTVFSVSTDEMYDNIFSVLDYLDEPFADSSAIAVYLLSKKTRGLVTVALSGDGGDELFGGYNKHAAELRARQNTFVNTLLRIGYPLLSVFPKSRQSKLTNLLRQAARYGKGLQYSAPDRYWQWCSLNSQPSVLKLLAGTSRFETTEVERQKALITNLIKEKGDLNDVLYADTQMVLPNDMLTKVDMMSMANSLEVRVPFLDYQVVDFAFSLPVSYKVNSGTGKKILKDAFRDELPNELFGRSKQGFEVPLLKWMKTGLRKMIEEDLLEKDFIAEQNIFDYNEIKKIKEKLFSRNPEDAHAHVWGLVVFQYWYKKYFLQND